MAENKEYFTQEMENGSIQISEDVVASVTGMAVLEVEGVCGLSSTIGTDIAEMLGMKTLSKGVRLSSTESGALRIDCDVVAKFGQNIFELAKNVQENVKSSVESVTGLTVGEVNVTVCAIGNQPRPQVRVLAHEPSHELRRVQKILLP